MLQKILVAVDGSEHSLKAVEYAAELASKHGCEIYLLHIVQKVDVSNELKQYMESEKIEEPAEYVILNRIGEKILDKAEAVARENGVCKVYKVIETGEPANKIVEYAKNNNVDSIIIGSRGLGDLKGLLMGSVSNKVCHIAECTCITVK